MNYASFYTPTTSSETDQDPVPKDDRICVTIVQQTPERN